MGSTFLRLCHYNFLFYFLCPSKISISKAAHHSSSLLFLFTFSIPWFPLSSLFAHFYSGFLTMPVRQFSVHLNSLFITNTSQFFLFRYLIFLFHRLKILHHSYLVLSSVLYWGLSFLLIFLLCTCLGFAFFFDCFDTASAFKSLDGNYKLCCWLVLVYSQFWFLFVSSCFWIFIVSTMLIFSISLYQSYFFNFVSFYLLLFHLHHHCGVIFGFSSFTYTVSLLSTCWFFVLYFFLQIFYFHRPVFFTTLVY